MYSWFKATVFALLAANTIAFGLTGTFSEALDSAAWLALLALFRLETGFGERVLAGAGKTAVHWARVAAAAAVVTAAIGYAREHEWLDAANSALWIAVVVLLEIEVRHPAAVATRRAGFASIAAALYAALATLVLVWFWQGEWFSGYDALLWLIAFVTLELDVLRYARPGAVPERRAGAEANGGG